MFCPPRIASHSAVSRHPNCAPTAVLQRQMYTLCLTVSLPEHFGHWSAACLHSHKADTSVHATAAPDLCLQPPALFCGKIGILLLPGGIHLGVCSQCLARCIPFCFNTSRAPFFPLEEFLRCWHTDFISTCSQHLILGGRAATVIITISVLLPRNRPFGCF